MRGEQTSMNELVVQLKLFAYNFCSDGQLAEVKNILLIR